MTGTHSYETHLYCAKCGRFYRRAGISGSLCPVHGKPLRRGARFGRKVKA